MWCPEQPRTLNNVWRPDKSGSSDDLVLNATSLHLSPCLPVDCRPTFNSWHSRHKAGQALSTLEPSHPDSLMRQRAMI